MIQIFYRLCEAKARNPDVHTRRVTGCPGHIVIHESREKKIKNRNFYLTKEYILNQSNFRHDGKARFMYSCPALGHNTEEVGSSQFDHQKVHISSKFYLHVSLCF